MAVRRALRPIARFGAMSAKGLAALQERIGHQFADQSLLKRALTHSSLAATSRVGDLERLGGLGAAGEKREGGQGERESQFGKERGWHRKFLQRISVEFLMSGHFSRSESMGTRLTRIRTDQIGENPLHPRRPRSYSFAPLEKRPDIRLSSRIRATSGNGPEANEQDMRHWADCLPGAQSSAMRASGYRMGVGAGLEKCDLRRLRVNCSVKRLKSSKSRPGDCPANWRKSRIRWA